MIDSADPNNVSGKRKRNWRSSKIIQFGLVFAIILYTPMTVAPFIAALVTPDDFFWSKVGASLFNGVVLTVWLWSRIGPLGDLLNLVLPILFFATGLFYAFILTGFAAAAFNGGRGTHVLSGLFMAPWSLLGLGAALLLGLLTWSVAGLLAALIRHQIARRSLIGLLLVHYIAAIVVLSATPLGDWDRASAEWKADKWLFIHSLIFYGAGQAALITRIVLPVQSGRKRFQFALRHLLIVVTAFAVFLAFAIPTGFLQYVLDSAQLLLKKP